MEMEEKNKLKRIADYHVLLVPKEESTEAKKFSFSMKPVAAVCLGIVLIIAIVLFYCYYLSNHLVEANQSVNELREQVEELTQQNDTLTTQNTELNEKVSILSDTVNSKVKEEEEREAELAKAFTPTGFPLKGTASYKEDETSLDGQPIAIFEAPQGTGVIATAQGTVSSIAGNDESGYIVMIDHGNGYYSVYRNGSKPKVEEGDEVTTSTELFIIETGHEELGYQIIENDAYIDPLSLMEIYG